MILVTMTAGTDFRFRFRKNDLPRLLQAFRMQGVEFMANNGVKFTAEEVLMIGLARFSTTGSLYITMSRVFGFDYSQLSRVVHLFVNHMLPLCQRFLMNNLDYWVPYFPTFAEANSTKNRRCI